MRRQFRHAPRVFGLTQQKAPLDRFRRADEPSTKLMRLFEAVRLAQAYCLDLFIVVAVVTMGGALK